MRLVGFDQVVSLAEARGCTVKRAGTASADVTRSDRVRPIGNLTSTDAAGEHWDVIAVLRACDIARAKSHATYRPLKTTPPDGLDVVAHGLREDLIVAAITAAGVWAYRAGQRTIPLEALLTCVSRGHLIFSDTKPAVREAAEAVVGAGLAEPVRGPRGGWSRARIEWLPAARRTVRYTSEEDDAIVSAGS